MTTQSTRAVPSELTLKGIDAAGESGKEWRRLLPDNVAGLVEQWSLTIDGPFPGLSYNYVAPVTRQNGTPAALKVWLPDGVKFRAEVDPTDEEVKISQQDGTSICFNFGLSLVVPIEKVDETVNSETERNRREGKEEHRSPH